MESANATEEALSQMTKMTNRAQLTKFPVSYSKLQVSKIVKLCDEATSSANEQRRKSSMLEACFDLFKDEPNP